MSSVDQGNQILTFDFRQEATSVNFNKYNSNIVKPGIYKGGRVYFESTTANNITTYQYVIEPFTAAFSVADGINSESRLLVNVTTSSNAKVASAAPLDTVPGNINFISPGLNEVYFLVMTLDWVKTINNYVSFSAIDDVSDLNRNQLILCKIRGNGTNKKPSIFYDYTSYGSYYETYDHKFITYLSGHGVTSNDGIFANINKPRKLIPYSSDTYVLNLDYYTLNNDFYYITFPPLSGEFELTNKENFREKIKFIYNSDGDVYVTYSAKTKITNNANLVSNYISYFIDEFGRLTITNGYDGVNKVFLAKFNLISNHRVLNNDNSF